MKTLIKPKEGLLILNPISKLNLKPEGELVDMNSYWRRRISDGDVEILVKQEEKKDHKFGGKK